MRIAPRATGLHWPSFNTFPCLVSWSPGPLVHWSSAKVLSIHIRYSVCYLTDDTLVKEVLAGADYRNTEKVDQDPEQWHTALVSQHGADSSDRKQPQNVK